MGDAAPVVADVLLHLWVFSLTGQGGERVSYGQFMSFVMPTMGQGEQSRIVIEPLIDDRCI